MQITRPDPILLGYLLKRSEKPAAWTAGPRVLEICSVSTCITRRPDNWVDRWDFNEAGYYSTPELASAAAPSERVDLYRLFAYELFPLRFHPLGSVNAIGFAQVFGSELHPVPDQRPLQDMHFLGYDIVQQSQESANIESPGQTCLGGGFGCSPLSCVPYPLSTVNQFCLVDRWEDAVTTALLFAKEQPEEGYYYIFGVWRKPLA